MKNFKNVLMLGLFVITLVFVTACGGNATTEEHKDHDHDAATEQPKATEAAEVYHCPMECEGEKTYDEAGKCPVCGMDLEVKES
ncbi:MAG: heavy metal-binding domain-containing protein [Saprospiraceae bacterium]|nr:heavy metal-binding domain-containing protein [Saprospiraceae bacterium]